MDGPGVVTGGKRIGTEPFGYRRWAPTDVSTMPLYMDIHRNVDGSAEDVAAAHRADLETQDEFGVDYKRYWTGTDGTVFCLFEAPNEDAGERVHREAHGLTADEIIEVTEGE